MTSSWEIVDQIKGLAIVLEEGFTDAESTNPSMMVIDSYGAGNPVLSVLPLSLTP